MNFKPFLQLSCQLVDANSATIEIEDRLVEFQTAHGKWRISSDIRSEQAVKALMGATNPFLEHGILLEFNPISQNITLSQNVEPLDTLDKFKQALDAFFSLLMEWESAFEPIAK